MTEPNTSWAEPEPIPAIGAASAPTPVPMPVAVPRKKGGGMTNVLLVIAAVVAVGGVTFALGRATAPAAASGFAERNGAGPGTTGAVPGASFDPAQGGPGGAGPGAFGDRTMSITGTVKSSDGTTMTITTASGTETTVDFAGSTYHSQAAATASDVKAGATVSVTVTGLGGFRGANASAAPTASGAPAGGAPAGGAPGGGAPGAGTITATDVTITSR